MNTPDAEAFDYCGRLVKTADEDRWLSACYAPPQDRRRLLAIYALHAEIVRVPSAVTEPPLGEIRLQWWREAIGEITACAPPRSHPVLQAASATGVLDAAVEAAFGAAIDARAQLLYGEPFTDAERLTEWLAAAEGYIETQAVRLLAPESALAAPAASLGADYAFVRYGSSLAPTLDTFRGARVRAIAAAAPAVSEAAGDVLPAVLHVALAGLYLRRAAPSGLAKRWRLFRAMAQGKIDF